MIPPKVKSMMELLEESGYEAYIIGGAVRDIQMGIEPEDFDIFTNATGEQILKVFPKGNVIGGEERQAKILTVVVDEVEVSQYRCNGDRTKTGDSLLTHQSTCDFTINSIAMNKEGKIFDSQDGINDIKYERLKFVGYPFDRLKEDPLRILRGIRFWTKYEHFTFDDIQIILDNINLLDHISPERIRDELMKILRYPQGAENLWCDEVINKIIPETKAVKNVEGGDHHNESVKKHMINSFEEAVKLTDDIRLRLACFLHDIGKGITYTIDTKAIYPALEGETEIHFYEHENLGAELMEERLSKLKFSKEDIKYITTLIRLHMYSYKSEPGDKSYIRFFNKLEDANIPIEDYIILIYCDHQANLAKPRIKFGDFIKGSWLYKKYYEIKY